MYKHLVLQKHQLEQESATEWEQQWEPAQGQREQVWALESGKANQWK